MASVAEAKRLCDSVKKMYETTLGQYIILQVVEVARSNDNTREQL